MQSQQIHPDFSVGYGTEGDERGVNLAGLIVFALALAVVVYLLQQKRKGTKR